MTRGSHAIRSKIEEINVKGLDASTKEKNTLTVLEIALEMCERGYSFAKVDLYKSSADEFIIEGNTLIPPFNSIPGLGTNAAISIVRAREKGEFLSKEDLQQRGKVSKTILEYLDKQGCLESSARTKSVIFILKRKLIYKKEETDMIFAKYLDYGIFLLEILRGTNGKSGETHSFVLY